MGESYFVHKPSARSRHFEFVATLRGAALRFTSDSGVFSKSRVDRGTALLAATIEVGPCETVLDLGCGIGALGIAIAKTAEAARVWMTDVNERAVALATRNAKQNNVADRVAVLAGAFYEPVAGLAFDHIATNPPIRAGRGSVTRMIAEAPAHLRDRGSLWLVARTRQGAPSLQALMRRTFGNADIVARGGGYRVVRAVRALGIQEEPQAPEQLLNTAQG